MHPPRPNASAAEYLRVTALAMKPREKQSHGGGLEKLVAVASRLAVRVGLGSLVRSAAAIGASWGRPPRGTVIPDRAPFADPIPASGRAAISGESTLRVVELIRLGDHELAVPNKHAALRPLARALSLKRSVRAAGPELGAAVQALCSSDIQLSDYRVALALLRMADEPKAESLLKAMASDTTQSTVDSSHYSKAASFFTELPVNVDGARVMHILDAREP